MTAPIPADARAAVETWFAEYDGENPRLAMTAVLAAADAVRLAGAGDVVERLKDRVWTTPAYAPLDLMADAATLITTLRADNARLAAERDAARETALREAADYAAECGHHAGTIVAIGLRSPIEGTPNAK